MVRPGKLASMQTLRGSAAAPILERVLAASTRGKVLLREREIEHSVLVSLPA